MNFAHDLTVHTVGPHPVVGHERVLAGGRLLLAPLDEVLCNLRTAHLQLSIQGPLHESVVAGT